MKTIVCFNWSEYRIQVQRPAASDVVVLEWWKSNWFPSGLQVEDYETAWVPFWWKRG